MNVKNKFGKIQEFSYAVGDYVTIVLKYLSAETEEDELYYHGYITEIEEDEGIWLLLDDERASVEYFSFEDLETVIDGDRIPLFAGSTKRTAIERDENIITEVKYCYNCDGERVYTNQGRKGELTELHCSRCGKYDWHNEEVKQRGN